MEQGQKIRTSWQFFDKLTDIIQVTNDERTQRSPQRLSGIVIDKARLEEGEPTEITKNENNDTISGTLAHLSTEELKAEIDKLRRIRNANP